MLSAQSSAEGYVIIIIVRLPLLPTFLACFSLLASCNQRPAAERPTAAPGAVLTKPDPSPRPVAEAMAVEPAAARAWREPPVEVRIAPSGVAGPRDSLPSSKTENDVFKEFQDKISAKSFKPLRAVTEDTWNKDLLEAKRVFKEILGILDEANGLPTQNISKLMQDYVVDIASNQWFRNTACALIFEDMRQGFQGGDLMSALNGESEALDGWLKEWGAHKGLVRTIGSEYMKYYNALPDQIGSEPRLGSQ